MNTYYKNSIDYHNDLDAFEARVRAEQEEAECLKIYNAIVDANKGQADAHRQAALTLEYILDYEERKDLYTMGNGG